MRCVNIMPKQPKEYAYCLRCGRKLKTEKARLIGMGETCAKKYNKNIKIKPLFS